MENVSAISLHRRQSQNPIIIRRRLTASITIRRRKVDQPIRPFSNISDPPILTLQKIFLADNVPPVSDDADDPLATQTPKEEIDLELRKHRPAIEHPARRRARRCVFQNRRFHSCARFAMTNRATRDWNTLGETEPFFAVLLVIGSARRVRLVC